MNGSELLKKLRKLAKQKGVDIRIEKHHGKGSHARGPVITRRIPIDGGHFFAGQGVLSAVYLAYTSESATR